MPGPAVTAPDGFRDQVRADIAAAFGLGRPPSRLDRLRSLLPAQRRFRRRWAAMERASAEARAREAEYAAALPARAAKIADDLNERWPGVLPDGMRFEWESRDD